MSGFLELVRRRYSVRSYKPDPVEQDKLDRILEAARLAPTAVNRQPFKIIVVPVAGHETEVQRIYTKSWFAQAPLVIAACGLPANTWVRKDGRSYNDVDVAIVMDHLIMAATAEGLGTCWVAAFDAVAAREVLALPSGVEPIAFTPLGYANDNQPERKRKSLDELVDYHQW